MKDIIIIGGGPAGLTAAVYVCRQNIDFSIITENIGGQTILSSQIENYTGFQLITGDELVKKMEEHTKEIGINVKEDVRVTKIEDIDGGYKIYTTDGECCSSKTLIIATGAKPRKLKVKGEEEFLNKGVAYCAVCDAPLFRGRDVAVIGGGNSALDAARQLSGIASKVYIITIEDKLKADYALRDKVTSSPSVEVITNGKTKEIFGDKMVEGINIYTNGEERKLEVQGVFIEIGWIPASDFTDIVEKNEKGEIKVDSNNRTSTRGIYAAGDVTDISKKQIIIAAGEGAKAALNAIDYISRKMY